MIKKNIQSNKAIECNYCTEGITIEQKIEQILARKEKFEDYDQKPKIYNERREGVIASQNIRGDALDIARVATSKKSDGNIYRRNKKLEEIQAEQEEKSSEQEMKVSK